MKRLWTIVVLAMRSAVRLRLVATLLGLVVVLSLALPAVIQHDGTIEGLVRVVQTYSLGAVSLMLALAVIWSSCGSLALDIQARQIQLVMVKPIQPWELWCGKWIAQVLLAGVMLACSLALTWAMLSWRVRAGSWTEEDRRKLVDQILVARQSVVPTLPDFEARARARMEEDRAAGRWPEGLDPKAAWPMYRDLARTELFLIEPGGQRAYDVTLPKHDPTAPAQLEFRFLKSTLDLEAVELRWVILAADGQELWSTNGVWLPRRPYALPLPSHVAASAPYVRVVLFNRHDRAAILLDPDEGLRLMVRVGTVNGNLVRAGLLLWVRLAVLAAIGVSAGAWFSMPVASLVGLAMGLMAAMAGYIFATAAHGPALGEIFGYDRPWLGTVEQWWRRYFVVLSWFTTPFRGASVLERLATGTVIPWGEVGQAVVRALVGAGLIAAVLGMLALTRRELGGVQE